MNEQAYGLAAGEMALIICFRHASTPYAFGDAAWAQYGDSLSRGLQPATANAQQPPSANPLTERLEGLIARGAHLAVCNLATTFLARQVAQAIGGDADEVYDTLVASMFDNAHLVPAGVMATTRSQEYGYSLLSAG